MLKLGDSIKGEKSFGVMNYEPPYTRPVCTVVWGVHSVIWWRSHPLD